MKAHHLSLLCTGSFLITTFILQWYQSAAYPTTLWMLLLLTMIGAGVFKRTIIIAISLGILISFWNVQRTTHVATTETIDTYATEQRVTITGTIATEPDRRPLHTKYTIEAEQIRTASGEIIKPLTGKVLVTDRRNFPPFHYGDRVTAFGTLEKPGLIDETFYYDRYLSRYEIYSVMYSGSMRRAERQNDLTVIQKVFSALYSIKERFEHRINQLYAEPHASFMAGLLTGSRKGIPEHLMQDFNITGLTHIIAISGYNITIIISIISGMLFWLPLKWRFIPAVSAIVLFTIFVGASAAVVRAAIMGILGLVALQADRKGDVRLSILWTACFMIAWNPKLLWYDAGFQLSFLAVLGLTELGDLLEWCKKYLPETLGIREAIQMTMAAQLSAVPLIILLFGRFSLIAPIANLLVAPFIPPAMLCGFLGVVLSYIWFPLGQTFAYIGWGCLQWIILSAQLMAAIPYASVDLSMSIWMLIVYYVLLISLILHLHRRRDLFTLSY